MIIPVQIKFDLFFVYVGEIGMSKDLDDLSTALFNGDLPTMWRKMTSQVLVMFIHQICNLRALCGHSSYLSTSILSGVRFVGSQI